MNRRNFLQNALAAIAGAVALPPLAKLGRSAPAPKAVEPVEPKANSVVFMTAGGVWLDKGDGFVTLYDVWEKPSLAYPQGRHTTYGPDGYVVKHFGDRYYPSSDEC